MFLPYLAGKRLGFLINFNERLIRTELESLIKKAPCPNNHICSRLDDEHLCKVKDVGLDSFVECLEVEPYDCSYAIFYGHAYYCQCPIRVYLVKKLKK